MIDLKFDGVSKRYRIRQEAGTDTEPHSLLYKLKTLRRRAQDFWAVRDVSFEVKRGEALGIIGHNGAGKSTILKLLSNITAPTSGEITINGRLAALIEVGSGFHPDLTGRENVYLSGSILGMRRREIAAKLDSIVDFAGISQFIDTPVKRYSSGMYVRLGFSIAAHLDPDILLLDEVLAVGDAAFQAKCINRIKELEQAGTTIVFISHDLKSVERLCNRVILMEHGQIAATGVPSEVIRHYAPIQKPNIIAPTDVLRFYNPQPNPRTRFEIEKIEALDHNGMVKLDLGTGDYVRFKITWRADEIVEHGGVEFGIHTPDGVPLIQYSTRPISHMNVGFHLGLNSVELEFEQLPLAAGEYILSAGLTRPLIDWLYRSERFAQLTIMEQDIFQSGFPLTSSCAMLAVPHRWIVPETNLEMVSEICLSS